MVVIEKVENVIKAAIESIFRRFSDPRNTLEIVRHKTQFENSLNFIDKGATTSRASGGITSPNPASFSSRKILVIGVQVHTNTAACMDMRRSIVGSRHLAFGGQLPYHGGVIFNPLVKITLSLDHYQGQTPPTTSSPLSERNN